MIDTSLEYLQGVLLAIISGAFDGSLAWVLKVWHVIYGYKVLY